MFVMDQTVQSGLCLFCILHILLFILQHQQQIVLMTKTDCFHRKVSWDNILCKTGKTAFMTVRLSSINLLKKNFATTTKVWGQNIWGTKLNFRIMSSGVCDRVQSKSVRECLPNSLQQSSPGLVHQEQFRNVQSIFFSKECLSKTFKRANLLLSLEYGHLNGV